MTGHKRKAQKRELVLQGQLLRYNLKFQVLQTRQQLIQTEHNLRMLGRIISALRNFCHRERCTK